MVDIGGTTADTEHDQLAVSGNLTIGGTLNVTLKAGYTPSPDDKFIIITATSISGTFSTLNLPTLATGFWQVNYNATNVELVIILG